METQQDSELFRQDLVNQFYWLADSLARVHCAAPVHVIGRAALAEHTLRRENIPIARPAARPNGKHHQLKGAKARNHWLSRATLCANFFERGSG